MKAKSHSNHRGCALDNGPLTDAKIRQYILAGVYGIDALRTELLYDKGDTFWRALRGDYGHLAKTAAEDVRLKRHALAGGRLKRPRASKITRIKQMSPEEILKEFF